MARNFRQIKAIEARRKKMFKSMNPKLNDNSGIYFLTREEDGFRYAYIGQAKHILTRLAQHMAGYQHIDNSIRKHGFYSSQNPTGWKVNALNFGENVLDEKEQYYIKLYANKGFQLKNKTSGSQGKGKKQIAEYRPSRGYRDGIIQGRKNSSREISYLFEKHLNVSTKKNPPTVNQQKALDKFNDFLDFYKDERGDNN